MQKGTANAEHNSTDTLYRYQQSSTADLGKIALFSHTKNNRLRCLNGYLIKIPKITNNKHQIIPYIFKRFEHVSQLIT